MKKPTLFILLTLIPALARAYDVKIDGVYYNIITKTHEAEVTSNGRHSYSGNVVIPSSVTYEGEEYCVTTIEESAFYECNNLKTITIPSSVTSVEEKAFYSTQITSVYISDLAAWCAIKFADFYSCPLYKSAKLYLNDEEIKDLVIPDGVASIGGFAFYGCKSFTSVTIPDGVTSIGESAFYGCTGLTSVHITDLEAWCAIQFFIGISNPLYYAHRLYLNDEEITELTIPDSVTSIGGGAFSGCTSLTSVNITDLAAWCEIHFLNNSSNPLSLAHKLYLNNEEIKELIIPDGVAEIRNYAFCGSADLTSVTIPNSVTSLGEGAFHSCTSLTSVNIPNSVTSLGDYAFYGCTGLTSVNIPIGLTKIGLRAFSGCTGLTSVNIPNSVTSLGEYAFIGCTGLTSVNISIGLTEIAQGTFYSCTGLTSVTIPNGVTEIRIDAFRGCSNLSTITLGGAISMLWYDSFSYCPNLTDVYCHAVSVPSASNATFTGSYVDYATLHVPACAIADYQTTYPWATFRSIVALDEDTPKCVMPTISYQNGELTFSSETEGVEFVSEITDTDIRNYYEEKVSLAVTYNISVYAMKAGYENSDIAYATLCWIEAEPKTEGIEDGIAQIPVRPVMIQMRDGTIIVTGANDGQEISVFDTSGQMLGRNISSNGTADISTSLRRGSTAVVRIGDKAVKVVLQ
ncbi:MAG: leucine-rich repeat domain-containing protein [Bacteroidales bacterium]|nr:leucine-rich repeat domain-containing protein [Bacteroidales bacterium]